MKSKGRAMTSIRMGATVAAASLLAVAAGSVSSAAPTSTSTPTVTISVASLIPGSTKAATQQFNAQVAEFEKANPTIKVNSVAVPVDRPDVRGQARRRHAADRVHGSVHRRPLAR